MNKTVEKLSTVEEMQDFAARFTKEEWEKLCAYQDFHNIFCENIMAARVLAEKILAGKHNGKTIDWRNNPYAK